MSEPTMNELRQRLTRVESRICRLADGMGISVGSPGKALDITMVNDTDVILVSAVLDVTLSEIVHFLTTNGVADKVATVLFRERRVATIYPLPKGERHDKADS